MRRAVGTLLLYTARTAPCVEGSWWCRMTHRRGPGQPTSQPVGRYVNELVRWCPNFNAILFHKEVTSSR
uniref:Putative secreted peptide n=1 Tax=Anopheles braziliensis TaxID=58242 RepID=A0A2M3ZX94_9DIPT